MTIHVFKSYQSGCFSSQNYHPKERSHVVVMCSMKKANQNKFNTIVRQSAIHVVDMILLGVSS
jgi:hypothetical protein